MFIQVGPPFNWWRGGLWSGNVAANEMVIGHVTGRSQSLFMATGPTISCAVLELRRRPSHSLQAHMQIYPGCQSPCREYEQRKSLEIKAPHPSLPSTGIFSSAKTIAARVSVALVVTRWDTLRLTKHPRSQSILASSFTKHSHILVH